MWLVILPFLKSVWAVIKPILTFTIPLPMFVILIAGLYLYYDRESAISKAVTAAVTKLVAGSELAAKDAIIADQANEILSNKMFQLRQDERISSEADANKQFASELSAKTLENKSLLEKFNNAKVANTLGSKINNKGTTCSVTQPLFDILSNQ